MALSTVPHSPESLLATPTANCPGCTRWPWGASLFALAPPSPTKGAGHARVPPESLVCPPTAPPLGSGGLGPDADESQELPWQTPLTALPSSHVDIGSLQCQEAELQPQPRRRGCNTTGYTQRDREAHIIQRPHWWARIAVLWDSGRGILEDSLEEVRFKGLYLESRGEQTVCTSGRWAFLTLTRVCAEEAVWSSGWGTDGKAWWKPVSTESCAGQEPGRAGPQPCHTQSWPWACPSRPTA